MKRNRIICFIPILSLFIFLINSLFVVSCNKEATCDCFLDSITVAKIFVPDGLTGKDAIIESLNPMTNFGDESSFGTLSWTNGGVFNNIRGLIEFDLSTIPIGTSIKKAILTLYWYPKGNISDQTGENEFFIYKISGPWVENTVTWQNQPQVYTTNSILVPKSSSINQDYTIDVTSFVQDMINNPTSNYGFLLKLSEEMPYKSVIVASSDCVNVDKRPRLSVYY